MTFLCHDTGIAPARGRARLARRFFGKAESRGPWRASCLRAGMMPSRLRRAPLPSLAPSPGPLVLALALAGLVTLASPEASADAAQPDGCSAFMRSRHVPSNAPAIPGTDDSVNAIAQIAVAPIGDVSFVVSADPRGLEDRGRWFLMRPNRPLPEGALQLAWALTCSIPASGGIGAKRVDDLVVGPSSPLPTSVGTVTAGSSPSIVRFVLSPELAAYVEVAQLNVTVGQARAASGRGTTARSGRGRPSSRSGTSRREDSRAPRCPAPSHVYVSARMDASELCAGKTGTASFPIELSAHIAGADLDPSALLGSIAVDCDAARREHEEATVSFSESGCAVAPRSRAAGARSAGSLAAAALALIGRRRRRDLE